MEETAGKTKKDEDKLCSFDDAIQATDVRRIQNKIMDVVNSEKQWLQVCRNATFITDSDLLRKYPIVTLFLKASLVYAGHFSVWFLNKADFTSTQYDFCETYSGGER